MKRTSWIWTHFAYFLVPLIAVFTKYDQFKYNIEMSLEDAGWTNWETKAHAEAERVFQEEYLRRLGRTPHYVRLECEILENSWTFRDWYSLCRYARNRQPLHRTSRKDCKCLEWLCHQCHALSGTKGKSGAQHKTCCNEVSAFIQNGSKKASFFI